MYGEDGLYEGGLSVRSTLDPKMQSLARKALMEGLIDFDRKRGGWRGPVATIPLGAGDWGMALAKIEVAFRRSGVAACSGACPFEDDRADIGLQPEKLVSGALSTERVRASIPFEAMKWARVKGRSPQYSVRCPVSRRCGLCPRAGRIRRRTISN